MIITFGITIIFNHCTMLPCMIEKIAIIMFPSKYATAKAFTTVLFRV